MCRNVEKEKFSSEMKYDSRMKINMTEKTSVEKTWKAYLNKIEPADRTAMELAKKRWNSVAKPIGSLGILEEDIIKIAGIRGPVRTGSHVRGSWCRCGRSFPDR